MGNNKLLRSAHAYLGSALVALFVLHAGTDVFLVYVFPISLADAGESLQDRG